MVGTNTKYMSFERLTVSEPESRAHFLNFTNVKYRKFVNFIF